MTMMAPLSLDDVERQLANAERIAGALRKIAEGLRELNGHAADVLVPISEPTAELDQGEREGVLIWPSQKIGQPRGREAVRVIVAERPGLWSLSEIVEEMKERDWFTSRKGAEVAVARLIAKGEAARTSKKGVYRFPAEVREVVSDESPTIDPSGNGSMM